MAESSYAKAGVDIAAGADLVERIKPAAAATARPGAMDALGGFGALFDLKATGLNDPILVAATDGVGTKLRLAIELDRLDTIGTDLVAMCVNDLICQGAEPLFFLDYYATAKLDVDRASQVVAGIAAACGAAGCALIGGETAEMPGMYAPGDFDLAGFAVGAVERGAILPVPARPGDVVLGLTSSGLHSNGFSLVRKILAEGDHALGDPFGSASLGDALLTPTRLYTDAARALRGQPGLRALAHITGGGLIENLPRALPEGLGAALDLPAWPLPPVFRWLFDAAALPQQEALSTFNCGIGLAVVVAADAAQAAAARLDAAGAPAHVIGSVTDTPGIRIAGAFA
ncbi:MAG: phosphoribosylformylglycinamidine cyclo-ligase [Pseudomonadota bacterium]